MPKIKCQCDNTINLGNIPCENEYLYISDIAFDNYGELIKSHDIYKEFKIFIKCPACQRIYFYENGYDNEPQIYIKTGS